MLLTDVVSEQYWNEFSRIENPSSDTVDFVAFR